MTQGLVRIQQIGKRKPPREDQPLDLPETVTTLRALPETIVRRRVEAFHERSDFGDWTKSPTDCDLEAAAETGKVGFDAKYNDRLQDADKAVETAMLAFQDGQFRVFLDENELESPDEVLNFRAGQVLIFLRLTRLSGRSW